MMRESAWRVTWHPSGATPRVLLDYGDLMDDELVREIGQLVDTGRFVQASNARPYGRGNRRRRLEITQLREYPTALAAWQAMLTATTFDPWGEKQLLRIEGQFGGSWYMRGAVLDIDRDLVTQPEPGYLERLALRIDGGLTPGGSPLTITGGWYNPPLVGGGTASGSITVTLSNSDHGLQPGDIVFVSGVAGVSAGYYPVTNVNGSQVTVDASSDQSPVDEVPDVTGGNGNGYVWLEFGLQLQISGMTDGADYAWKYAHESVGFLRGISYDAFGRATINDDGGWSKIFYYNWYGLQLGVGLDPLPIDGEDHVQPPHPVTFTQTSVTQQWGSPFHVELWREGVKIDEHLVAPSWRTQKHYQSGGPTQHILQSGQAITMTLRADGGTARLATGVSERITGGTLTKA